MKKRNTFYLFFFLFFLSFLTACGKEGKKKEDLSAEFTLQKVPRELGSEVVNGIIFNEVISAGKVSSLAHDSTGSSLGYILTEEVLEKFIRLFQEDSIFGVEISKDEYQSAMRSAVSGYMIEFMDSKDQFKEGVARLSCITGTNKYYLNIIQLGEGSKVFRITLPNSVVDFLNEQSKAHYSESSSNPGWFDKAFNK